jgi:hypothetical protein
MYVPDVMKVKQQTILAGRVQRYSVFAALFPDAILPQSSCRT